MKHIIHFNRRATNDRVWTVHNSRGCFHLKKLFIDVPVVSEFKPKSASPKAFFIAHGELHTYRGGEGWITKA